MTRKTSGAVSEGAARGRVEWESEGAAFHQAPAVTTAHKQYPGSGGRSLVGRAGVPPASRAPRASPAAVLSVVAGEAARVRRVPGGGLGTRRGHAARHIHRGTKGSALPTGHSSVARPLTPPPTALPRPSPPSHSQLHVRPNLAHLLQVAVIELIGLARCRRGGRGGTEEVARKIAQGSRAVFIVSATEDQKGQ
ncbi:hypothetical protein E2C01_086059 [Portunus trituberculatus]|uniref:Uncharacterized protein n=1 Tax=Portunus trituberculatus TaxID=210409 RepID=A0A5B7JAI2_PORTR|nr:hypothetical protein [Portunus trituberculatus]